MKVVSKQTGPTLTDVNFLSRQAVKVGAIVIVTIIVLQVLITSSIKWWKAMNPPLPTPPSVGFGRLPQLKFPTQTAKDKPQIYTLQTPGGRFPNFGDRAKVFLVVQNSRSIMASEKAKKIAQSFDFVFKETKLKDEVYRWTKSNPIEASLDVNLNDYNLKISSDYLSRPELLKNKELPQGERASDLIKLSLSRASLLADDVATSSGKIAYLKSLGGELFPAESYSDADFIKVDINRVPIDNIYQMYTATGDGIISGVVSGVLKGTDSIVDLAYRYHTIDYQQFHTYPLRTAVYAWNILQKGEGYIVNKGLTSEAVVRSVTLGYYDSFDSQEYLQPIYIFTGDNNFIGYVSAVDPAYLEQTVSP